MAYVRTHGNQLAIVQGDRDSETGKVQQRVLFKICSKREALEAIGDGKGSQLERLLEARHPRIKFDWTKIRAGIEERMADLPDIYPYRQAEVPQVFRDSLCGFVRALGSADPQTLYPASVMLKEHRFELEYLRDLIDRRLRVCDQTEHRWNSDNAFYWRLRTRDEGVPPDEMERIAGLLKDGKLDQAEALAQLFIDSYDGYADGHNYLGHVARERDRLDEAIEHFERAITEGRELFPSRFAKKHFWVDHATRPYIRGIRNLANTLVLAQKYDEALEASERLASECGDAEGAACTQAVANLLNLEPDQALAAALKILPVWPEYAYVAAFACWELQQDEDAMAWFLHGLLTRPRTGAILLGDAANEKPTSFEQVSDHNTGVELRKLLEPGLARSSEALKFFDEVRGEKSIQELLSEKRDLDASWRQDRSKVDRWSELNSPEFAFRRVALTTL